MCAILDADIAHEAFGFNRTSAGDQFRRWIDSGRGQLVVGGSKMKKELYQNGHFKEWLSEAQRSPRVRFVNDESVNTRTTKLEDAGVCRSNDKHVIALAQESRARLLYSRDCMLKKDFGNPQLIKDPGGVIYPRTHRPKGGHLQWLINHGDLCR